MYQDTGEIEQFVAFVKNSEQDALRAARLLIRLVRIRNITRKGIDSYQKTLLQSSALVSSLNQAIHYTQVKKEDPPKSMSLVDGKNLFEGLKDALDTAGFSLTKENILEAPKLEKAAMDELRNSLGATVFPLKGKENQKEASKKVEEMPMEAYESKKGVSKD